MNGDFWDHMLNAASHLFDAKRMSDAQREAQRAEAAAARAQARKAKVERAPAQASFSSPPASGADCCIAKRRFKVK